MSISEFSTACDLGNKFWKLVSLKILNIFEFKQHYNLIDLVNCWDLESGNFSNLLSFLNLELSTIKFGIQWTL